MLYGILCVQAYVYSYNFPDDRRSLKFLAYFVFLLETIQTALTGGDVYFWFAEGFGNTKQLQNNFLSPIDGQIMDASISLIVQGFYCYRIWTLNKRWWLLCVVIAILSLSQAIASALSGIDATIRRTYTVLEPGQFVWLITSALADILIAVAMVLLLRQMRGYEGKYSSYVLPRIVRLTIETNILTATVTIVSVSLCFGYPHEIYYLLPITVLGKLYSNTLFLTLNNWIYFRDHPPPGSLEDSINLGSTARPPASPLAFVQARIQQSATSSHNVIKHDSILPIVEEDAQKGISEVVILDP